MFIDADSRPVQRKGVSSSRRTRRGQVPVGPPTSVPGVFFLGLHWMHTFKSGLLSGVGTDAQFIADKLDQRT